MAEAAEHRAEHRAERLYLDLLADSLMGLTNPSPYHALDPRWYGARKRLAFAALLPLQRLLGRAGLAVVRSVEPPAEEDVRAGTVDLRNALTMIGSARLDHLRSCIETVIDEDVPGDLIETGIWRGGAVIFMRGALEAFGDESRHVWAADSFQGLPTPDAERYPLDRIDPEYPHPPLGVAVDAVKASFRRYGLLDERVHFLEGWFRDTLPGAPIDRLAVLRLDGDLYESTMDALVALYPKLAVGGFAIVDDFGAIPACAAAVHDYRAREGIEEPIERVDYTCVFWRRTR